ncbi:MAG: helix-turn-helix domain-containing protein, partial [Sedimentibacter sp.]
AEHLPHLYSNNKVRINDCIVPKNENITNLSEIIEKAECEYISNAYIKLNRNKTETAKMLGISIRSLYYKMEKYGIE